MSLKKNCDVFLNLCGAYNQEQWGRCDIYSGDRLWLEPDIRKRIAHCEHRKKMNNPEARKRLLKYE